MRFHLMQSSSRRRFLTEAALSGSAIALAPLMSLLAKGSPRSSNSAGYGQLRPVASRDSGETILALPDGFNYTVVSRAGAPMSDGRATPQLPDGMATFVVGNELRIVRNHEVNDGHISPTGPIGDVARSYDERAGGGTTTLVIDRATRSATRAFVSLSGTLQNCAGGATPWGSWISCEETTLGTSPAMLPDRTIGGGFAKPHGYCFEVPASANDIVDPIPITALGRFKHEAIAIDPRTGVLYLTEDNLVSGLYRFTPRTRARLSDGGVLEMLAIRGKRCFDTRTKQRAGVAFPVEWVRIDDPDPANADGADNSVFAQGEAQGGATFARLEGCFFGRGSIFVNATTGGTVGCGQVWQLKPSPRGDKLSLVVESPSPVVLDSPDNLCIGPRGGLLLCEDAPTRNHLRGVDRNGRLFDVARNIYSGFEGSELAGVTFDPAFETLFVNLQAAGLTLAIWGPWERGPL